MAQVDKPFDFIDKFRQGAAWTKSDGTLTEEAINQLENFATTASQMYIRTGGSTDVILEITNSETHETSTGGAEYHDLADDNEQIEDQIYIPEPIDYDEPDYTPVIEWSLVEATTNTTVTDHDFVEGTLNATIKMDSKAGYGSQVETGNGDGSRILIDGDGVELRYAGKRGFTMVIAREGTFIHWYRFKNHWRGG